MENRKTITQFTTYIETLCEKHTLINHTKAQKHFLKLGQDNQLQEGKHLYYPIVTIEHLSNVYIDQIDNYRKKRNIELMFLDHIRNPDDIDMLNKVWNNMEEIAEDFLRRIRLDKSERTLYPCLKHLKIESAELNFIENIQSHLCGVLLSFEIETPFDNCISEGRFR